MVLFFFFFGRTGTEAELRALVESDRSSGGAPELPKASRANLENWLSRVLVRQGELCRHIDFLSDCYDRECHNTDVLSDADLDALLEAGPSTLDDKTLARLILAPYDLFSVHDEVLEQQPEWWVPEIERYGQELLEQHGISIPDTLLPPE